MTIHLKRVYEPVAPDDGERVLVDRLWPRGIAKSDPRIGRWLKEVAPSAALRTEFHHDPAHWQDFRAAYAAELAARPNEVEELLHAARAGTLTLVFAAKDAERNNAVVLRDYLEARLR